LPITQSVSNPSRNCSDPIASFFGGDGAIIEVVANILGFLGAAHVTTRGDCMHEDLSGTVTAAPAVGISTLVTAGVAVMAVSPTVASPAPVLPSYSIRWPFDEMGVRYESGHNKPGIVRTELRKGSSEDGSANEVAVGVQKGVLLEDKRVEWAQVDKCKYFGKGAMLLAAAQLVLHPLDVLKTRIQMGGGSPSGMSARSVLADLYRAEGVA
jgi:hypothetical protein